MNDSNEKIYKIQINYKSGNSIIVTCTKFEIELSTTNEIVKASWKNMKPVVIHIGLTNIESIFQLD